MRGNGNKRLSFSEQAVKERLRERWKTYNLQWMGEEKFQEFILQKIRSEHYQSRHLSYLENNLGNLSGKSILDVGCGEGGLLIALKNKGLQVLGVDLSKTALEIAHLQLSCRESVGNPSILGQAEGHHLPFRDNTFDLVTSVDTLEHIPDLPGFLGEIKRILKKGGHFYANTPNRHWPYETHCRMYLLHWLPRRLRPPIIKTFFPKRVKKLEKLEYLDALNLLTPSELDKISYQSFSNVREQSSVLLNRYKNDHAQRIRKDSHLKNGIIRTVLGATSIPGISILSRSLLNRLAPEIILIAEK